LPKRGNFRNELIKQCLRGTHPTGAVKSPSIPLCQRGKLIRSSFYGKKEVKPLPPESCEVQGIVLHPTWCRAHPLPTGERGYGEGIEGFLIYQLKKFVNLFKSTLFPHLLSS
jgi:hypothetical protein